MWTVGDTTTHIAFLAALVRDHGYTATAKTYLDGDLLGEIPIVGDSTGIIKVNSRQRVRRQADLEVPERYWPTTDGDLLSPWGVELRVWVTISQGTRTFPEIPVFTGRVEQVTRERRTGKVKVRALDRFAQINDEGFEQLRSLPVGAITAGITTLIHEVYPDATVTDTTGSTATIPTGLMWRDGDGSRGQAVDDLALAIGAEVIELPDGNFVIRPMPSLSNSPVWTVATGEGGVIVRDAQTIARTGVANRWIVVGEQTTAAAPVRAVVTEQYGPLAYGSPFGRVVRKVSSPLIGSYGQAVAAGEAYRVRVRGLARTRDVTVIANPALEAGDVLQVEVPADDSREWHIADEFDVPLTPLAPTMTIGSRSEA